MINIAKRIMSAFIAATIIFSGSALLTRTAEASDSTAYTLSGEAHVQDYGDRSGSFADGELVIGTTHESKRLERICISLVNNTGYEGSITYQVHVQNIGWMDWVQAGQYAGTEGQSLRLEGIRIKLTGDLAKHYSVFYSVHIQNYGDNQGWVSDGALAGTTGESLRLENLHVKLEALDSVNGNESVSYRVHRQDYGWETDWKKDGDVSGTTGESKRLEAISMSLIGTKYTGGITYRTQIQDIGWESDWASDGSLSGTCGQGKRLEAIEIKLTGDIADYYDVYYRVHAQDYGWMAWACNGASSGTSRMSKRLEAIQVVLVAKGSPAPSVIEGIASDCSEAYHEGSAYVFPALYVSRFQSIHQDDIAAINSAVGSGHRDYLYSDVTSSTEHDSTQTMSDADWNACAKFASENFDASWSTGEKVLYTLYWIHYNVTYGSGSMDYAVSVFQNRRGRCAQYNGAICEMMCYLGVNNVRLVNGYRSKSATSLSGKFSHYWCELSINGVNYVVECGNTSNDSGDYVWYYFVEPYGVNNAKKYVKCGLVMR
ncbi:MAG: hypothetical protein LKG26_07445 [Saccharofermentans sp.]|jgi:uncharacterized protein YjdB|nr:hypothetical protein [Mageeibacillus sp.]MCI1263828.1 hypothetical protein [Saccharofermentans sp.]MCI1275896.1 hypothetical protein [Saccharofermentans sp.]MCI1769708.1 hypothetical protein [Mageeibacillus sp.]MCI2043822.1 hypothetical protein [Mageeibacillus sp.]